MRSELRYLVALVLVLGCASARALPCASASLGDYLALGAGGCTVGGLTFSGFSLPDVLSPMASAIDPGVVAVAPVSGAQGSGLQLRFDPVQSAGTGEFLALRLGFDVQGSGITGAQAALLGPVAIGDAAITLVEDVCLGASFADPVNLVCAGATQSLAAIAIESFVDNPVGAPIGPLDLAGVVAEIGIDGGLAGSALLAGAELRFLQAAAVPLPSSLSLLALAALTAALTCAARRKSPRAAPV
jgi:hypothetical protein